MNNLAENIGNFLSHTIYVHIYSSPNFLMETFINIIMIFIHCLLIAQVNAIIEEVNVSTKKYQIKKNLAGTYQLLFKSSLKYLKKNLEMR